MALSPVLLVVLNSLSGGVQETFQRLLSLAVVLQLVPFLYMFAALLKFAFDRFLGRGRYTEERVVSAGASGLVTTSVGIVLAFFPAQQITSSLSYEIWMFGGTVFFIGLAALFFFLYGRRKASAGGWRSARNKISARKLWRSRG